MEPPRVKKDYPCGRQCIHIVRRTPWALCECNRFKLTNNQNNKNFHNTGLSFENWCKLNITGKKFYQH